MVETRNGLARRGEGSPGSNPRGLRNSAEPPSSVGSSLLTHQALKSLEEAQMCGHRSGLDLGTGKSGMGEGKKCPRGLPESLTEPGQGISERENLAGGDPTPGGGAALRVEPMTAAGRRAEAQRTRGTRNWD